MTSITSTLEYMKIQQYMGVIKATFCFVLVLNLVAKTVSSEEKKESRDELLTQLFDPASGLFDKDTAEALWTTCREDLIHSKEELRDLELCLPSESSSSTNGISSESGSIARENIQSLINTCHPQLKRIFLRCLRKHNLPSHVSRYEADSKIRHVTHVGSLSSRRNLGHASLQHVSKVEYDAEPPPPPPARSGKIQRPGFAPPPPPPPHKSEADIALIITAVVVTAGITFVIATLFFCCCYQQGQANQYDEKPLLSMSMSDISVGSSSNNNIHKISTTNEKLGYQSYEKNSMQEINSAGVGGDAARPSFDLKPPPGRVAVAGSTPLKPPPGRPDPLPHEPPSVEPSINSTAVAAPPPPAPPPPPAVKKGGPPPPPPPMGGGPPAVPPRGPLGRGKGPRGLGAKAQVNAGASSAGGPDANKTKLKPFFWDKVQANSDQTMVWNQLKAGSFVFNEEMMENLFGYTPVEKPITSSAKEPSPQPQLIQIIEAKKAQNLSILLRALNVTLEEVRDALLEGNELPPEFLQTLLKMQPTQEEELKLRLYTGDLSLIGPADRFLKTLVDIPFAFKRIETLHYMCSLSEELAATKESFATLGVACTELKNSRLFLKLLEAVLKTGNRMNDGTYRGGAQAFKLDTLLKLADVKGVDGKTTLLHFVVQEIIRTEGIRAARMAKESHSFSSIKTDDLLEEVTVESEDNLRELGLQVVSRLSSELEHVKKAAALDADGLTGTTARLGHGFVKAKEFVNKDLKDNVEGDKGFYEATKSFVECAEADVTGLLEDEKKIMALVKSTGDYFHGNTGKDEGLRLFLIIRDFLVMLDKVCKEIKDAQKKTASRNARPDTTRTTSRGSTTSEISTRPPPPDIRQKLQQVVSDRRMDDFSSDDDSP